MRFAALLLTCATCWLMGTASGQTQAEPFNISGIVRSAEGEPLAGATVLIVGTSPVVAAATDGDGRFALTWPKDMPSQVRLRCSFIGMETVEQDVPFTADSPMQVTLVLENAALGLDAVVVSAGRFEQSASEVTVSLDVLPPRLVESKGSVSLETALEQNPGVSMVDGEPQIRSGSGFSYGAGSRVMVLVDDLPVLSGDAGRPTWSFLPLENLEQIEILKGSSSVLYGSAALSGVINIRTRYPDARPLTRVSLQHGLFSQPQDASAKSWSGTNMQTNLRFLHSQQLGKWDVVIGGNVLGDEGYLAPEDSEGDSKGYRPWNINHFAAEKRGRMNVNLRRRETKVKGLQYGINTNWQVSEFLNTLIWEQAPDRIYGSYEGAATRTQQVSGTVDPHVQYSRGQWRHALRGRWFHLVNDNDNNQSNASDILYGEYQANWRPSEAWNLTAGGVISQTWSEAELYSGGETGGLNAARNLAAFAQVNWNPVERIHLTGGMRYEHFDINGEEEGRPVFRFGANGQLAEGTFLRASWGEGFRFPTIAERFIRTGLGSLQIYPNANLQSESAWSAEVGLKQGLALGGLKGFADVAVFHQRYENFIEFTFGPWGGLGAPLAGLGFTSLNTGRTMNTGVEFTFNGRFEWGDAHQLDLIAGYTFTNPVALEPDLDYNPFENSTWVSSYLTTSYDTTGHLLKYRSQHLVRFDAQWTHERWSAGVSVRYQSALQNFDAAFVSFEEAGFVEWGLQDWLDANPNLPVLFDLRLSWAMREHQRWSLLVNNAGNAAYAIRPLAMEAPRLVQLMYTYELK